MNISQFVAKWRKSSLKERAASHEHFIDLCHLFDHPTPAEMDGAGDNFTFEREIAKANGRKGRADVWKRDFFAWEYKSKGKSLDDAHDQLSQYRESLLNPPLMAACDMSLLDIRTNFTRRATRRYEVPLEDLGSVDSRRIVENLFWDPNRLEPGQDVEAITDKAAGDLAGIAKSMRARGLDPNQVALFLDRVVFCLFAQDVRLLKDRVFTQIVEKTHRDPRWISKAIFDLFRMMNKGGDYGFNRIPHFNGDLFADVRPLELSGSEIDALYKVARRNWGEVDASIIGTLFERGMDPTKEAEIGTHYTRRDDISAIVDPVVMQPLRREWKSVRERVDDVLDKGSRRLEGVMRARSPKRDTAKVRKARAMIRDFHQRLQDVTILDPACGSGNFLFIALQKLKDLEKEVLIYASQRNIDEFLPAVGPWQLRGIEKSPYAYDLARMTIWIGWLQWTKANGYKVDWEPILRSLSNLRNEDAVIDLSDPDHPREPEWPEAEFIVGNPPFLGDKKMRSELGDDYVSALRSQYGGRIPGQSDLCCYWFEKSRREIEAGRCQRAGLLATQGIRGGANREVLARIKESGDIFFAEGDRPWILDGANVHISMICFDDGTEDVKRLDGQPVKSIHANLTSGSDVSAARRLRQNRSLAFLGTTKKAPFDIPRATALKFLISPNPNGLTNSDVVLPYANGLSVTRRPSDQWIIDFGERDLGQSALYEGPFEYVKETVRPLRRNHREARQKEKWWLLARPCLDMKAAVAALPRFLVTPVVSKHRVFTFLESPTNPDHQLYVFASDNDYFLGVLQSRLHEVWALRLGTRLETRPRYTPTTCFETFPFPQVFAGLEGIIAEAARELDQARQEWLNPLELTREEVIEFPGTASGPWAHLVTDPDRRGIGTVRYVRRVPRNDGCASRLAERTLTNLYNRRPTWLDLAHRKLDEAVFSAYGWAPDLSEDEILARLLALNLERTDAQAQSEGGPSVTSRLPAMH